MDFLDIQWSPKLFAQKVKRISIHFNFFVTNDSKLEFGFNFAYAGADIQWDVDQNIQGNIDWSAWSLMGRLNLHLGNSKK